MARLACGFLVEVEEKARAGDESQVVGLQTQGLGVLLLVMRRAQVVCGWDTRKPKHFD